MWERREALFKSGTNIHVDSRVNWLLLWPQRSPHSQRWDIQGTLSANSFRLKQHTRLTNSYSFVITLYTDLQWHLKKRLKKKVLFLAYIVVFWGGGSWNVSSPPFGNLRPGASAYATHALCLLVNEKGPRGAGNVHGQSALFIAYSDPLLINYINVPVAFCWNTS